MLEFNGKDYLATMPTYNPQTTKVDVSKEPIDTDLTDKSLEELVKELSTIMPKNLDVSDRGNATRQAEFIQVISRTATIQAEITRRLINALNKFAKSTNFFSKILIALTAILVILTFILIVHPTQ